MSEGDVRGLPIQTRLAIATFVSLLGLIVFMLLRQLLVDLIGDPWLLVGCWIGGFMSTAILYPRKLLSLWHAIAVGAGIVWGTYASIAAFHAVSEFVSGRQDESLFGECLGVIGWATFATSWWLLPAVVVVLLVLDYSLHREATATT